MSGRSKQELKEEIDELRGNVVEAVQAMPSRAKQHGSELKEEAIERGAELGYRMRYCGSELRDQAVDAAERAREAVSRTPRGRWATLVGAGLTLITLTVIVRRVRTP